MVKPIDKDKLYELTDWASWECENLIKNLHRFGLVVVKEEELEQNNMFCSLCEDDLK